VTGWGAGGLFVGDVKGDLPGSRLAFSTDLSTKHVVKAAPGCVTARGAYAPFSPVHGEKVRMRGQRTGSKKKKLQCRQRAD